jgi:hypothetical protein
MPLSCLKASELNTNLTTASIQVLVGITIDLQKVRFMALWRALAMLRRGSAIKWCWGSTAMAILCMGEIILFMIRRNVDIMYCC